MIGSKLPGRVLPEQPSDLMLKLSVAVDIGEMSWLARFYSGLSLVRSIPTVLAGRILIRSLSLVINQVTYPESYITKYADI